MLGKRCINRLQMKKLFPFYKWSSLNQYFFYLAFVKLYILIYENKLLKDTAIVNAQAMLPIELDDIWKKDKKKKSITLKKVLKSSHCSLPVIFKKCSDNPTIAFIILPVAMINNRGTAGKKSVP